MIDDVLALFEIDPNGRKPRARKTMSVRCDVQVAHLIEVMARYAGLSASEMASRLLQLGAGETLARLDEQTRNAINVEVDPDYTPEN